MRTAVRRRGTPEETFIRVSKPTHFKIRNPITHIVPHSLKGVEIFQFSDLSIEQATIMNTPILVKHSIAPAKRLERTLVLARLDENKPFNLQFVSGTGYCS